MADLVTVQSRTILELRALLDLSYAREKELANGLVQVRALIDGAALAPAMEASAEVVTANIDAVIELLAEPPAPPEGLFIKHAMLVCELTGAKSANEYLRRQLDSEHQRTENYEVHVRDLRSHNAELKAEQVALRALIDDPAVCKRVMEAAKQLMPKPQFKEGEHRE